MNKFKGNLIANSGTIKANRAELIANNTLRAQSALISKLEDQRDDLLAKVLAHTDLYPDSELSLQVGKADFDATVWVNKLQDLKVQLLNKKVELTTAQETYNEYFTDAE